MLLSINGISSGRQSALIESLLLGIPVPSLFMATNKDASWDVVDGVQHLTTILNFIGNGEELKKTKISFKPLRLSKLEKLEAMNGVAYEDLSPCSLCYRQDL